MPENHATPSRDWSKLHLWQIQPLRDVLLIGLVVWLIWLGSRLSIVTVPMLLALLLAYLVEPVVRTLTRRGRVSRNFVAAMGIILAGALIVVPAALGLTYGVVDGTAFVERQFGNAKALVESVDAPENQVLRSKLPPRWRSLRDFVVEQRVKEGKPNAVPAPLPNPAPDGSEPGGGEMSITEEVRDNLKSFAGQVTTRVVSFLKDNSADLSRRAVNVGTDALRGLFSMAGLVGKALFGAFLTAFFFFFFSTGFGRVRKFLEGFIPAQHKGRVMHLLGRMDRAIAGFVRGRLTICACQIVLFTIAYKLIGVPAPFIVGPIVGLLTLVPYAAGIAVPVIVLLLWLAPAGDPGDGMRAQWWFVVLAPVVVQVISQVLDDYVLTPTIQGKSTDMSMPLILFASIAGGVLGGFYGLLLAIPVAACVKILFEELVLPRIKQWAAGKASDPLPIDP